MERLETIADDDHWSDAKNTTSMNRAQVPQLELFQDQK